MIMKNNEYYSIVRRFLNSSYLIDLDGVVVNEPAISRYVRADKADWLAYKTNMRVHSLRVSALCYTASKFLKKIGLNVDVKKCTEAGALHDSGKTILPREEEEDFSKWGDHVRRSVHIARVDFKEDERVCNMIWKHQFPFPPPPYLPNSMPTTIEEWIINISDKVETIFFRWTAILISM
jgi:putative nucleotidyltransferase with HDIG domain